jgi:hypothetical protein
MTAKEFRNEAAIVLNPNRHLMVRKNEREVPESKYKSSAADWDAMKRSVQQQRKAERAARKAAKAAPPKPPTKPKALRCRRGCQLRADVATAGSASNLAGVAGKT